MFELEVHIYKVLATGFASLLMAYLAAKFALKSFFKQKEYELVKDRYLNNGVDKVRAYNIELITNFNWNYCQVQKCLARTYHEEKSFPPEACLKSLRDIGDINACGLEHTRITRLLNDDSLWQLNEHVVGNVLSQNEWLIRVVETLQYSEKSTPEALLKLKNETEETQKELHIQMSCVTSFLTEVTDILEESQMDFSSIKRFSTDATVSTLVENIRDLWHSEMPKT
ncbi:hypothetical protein [Motilimonas pumila]|uniref:Uncharacterized protein n=1 Tax=Motilimonas pumila TaxID=2303987 RepID=A0A418Y8Z5_9GAMM|nr:hypothetical protein [Motilimonas pumila]RJG35824.1 hypothetical protein D1Z90_20760 [Motilimonas pumila]